MTPPCDFPFQHIALYALAKTTGESLLFIGADFGHTDIVSAIA
jgi:uncharacterized protein with PIN domain